MYATITIGFSACASVQQVPTANKTMSVKDIVQHSKPAIVRVEAFIHGQKRVGTGFIVGADGLIATNLHVIHGSTNVSVRLLDGTSIPVKEVINYNLRHDLAVIRVAAPKRLPVLRLGDSDRVSAGDRVIAIGNPLGVLDYSVSDGLISSVRVVNPSLTVLQISAPISRGSSGGPLFNSRGEVIGVATMVSNRGQNLNFGIPSNYVRSLLGKKRGQSIASFSNRLRPQSTSPKQEQIVRRIPIHDVNRLAGCGNDSILGAIELIRQAIRVGAPIYNQGGFEACYRIYEGAALRLERQSSCQLIRHALGHGLLQSGTKDSYKAKAWALRDAFDGLMRVVVERARLSNAHSRGVR